MAVQKMEGVVQKKQVKSSLSYANPSFGVGSGPLRLPPRVLYLSRNNLCAIARACLSAGCQALLCLPLASHRQTQIVGTSCFGKSWFPPRRVPNAQNLSRSYGRIFDVRSALLSRILKNLYSS
jgi:hypothetical protein